jgi:AcrR family transcriptional regulator
MPRNGDEVRRRLQLAALELYQRAGYESTTAAEIAARAGVTERTFFRHFPDKREVLFQGEASLADALTSAVRNAPPTLSPWATLFVAFRSVEPLFVDNRAFSEPRRRIIASSPTLQEREQAKARSLITALASALSERGVHYPLATLAAQIGMAALGHAFESWLDGSGDLEEHLVRAFREVRELSSSGLKVARCASAIAKR